MVDEVRTVWTGGAALGEGPVWDAASGALWFVDIKAPSVHRLDPASGDVASWPAPAQVGWVFPTGEGTMIAGLQTGLARFDPADGSFAHLADVEPERPGNRLNDATVGADGSVWFGSMDDGHEQPTGRFFRFDGASVTPLAIEPVPITNGPALSPDGTTLYHVDTVGGVIRASPVADGRVTGEPRAFVRIDPAVGHPDGVSTDSAGNVWVAIWGGWCARLYAPDATLLREVRLPCAQVTKVALGGPDLRTAYVTTAQIGLDAAALADQPEAGHLFAFDVEVSGRALPPVRLG